MIVWLVVKSSKRMSRFWRTDEWDAIQHEIETFLFLRNALNMIVPLVLCSLPAHEYAYFFRLHNDPNVNACSRVSLITFSWHFSEKQKSRHSNKIVQCLMRVMSVNGVFWYVRMNVLLRFSKCGDSETWNSEYWHDFFSEFQFRKSNSTNSLQRNKSI